MNQNQDQTQIPRIDDIEDETIIEAVDFDLDTETTFDNGGNTDFF